MRACHTALGLVVVVLSTGCSEPMSPTSPTALERGAPALTASIGAGSAPGTASTAETPFKGTLEGTVDFAIVGPALAHVVISASGVSTHLGRFTVEVPHDVDLSIARDFQKRRVKVLPILRSPCHKYRPPVEIKIDKKGKSGRELILLVSTADTGYFYTTSKYRKRTPDKLVLKKYDPVVRKHVEIKETKI